MLKRCRFSIVGLHLLLLSHFVHTFVLLTASMDDVKKIAHKFVSEDLAEKIADFIARATETFAQSKNSEENITDNSQVSAENRMYNIERQAHAPVVTKKSKDENAGKDKVQHSHKKKKQVEIDDTETTPKPRKDRKTKSRYIIEEDKKDSNEKELQKSSAEKKYNKRQEDNMVSVTDQNKKQKKKKKVNPYKLLTNFASDENNSMGGSLSKEKKETEAERHRAFDNEIEMIKKAAIELDTGKTTEKVPERYEHKTHRPEIYENSKTPEKESLPVTNEPEQYENDENTKKKEKVTATGPKRENGGKEKKWWEQDLPQPEEDEAKNRKAWF